jgi:hypothetical protein
MMIPYPSVSPIPIVVNGTGAAEVIDRTATIVTSVAVGALGITSVAVLIQYLKVKTPSPQIQELHEKSQELEIPEIKVDPAETYICVNTVDLEEITQILTTFKKRFHVMQGRP